MMTTPIETRRLRLEPKTRGAVLAEVERMPPDIKAELSADWLALLQSSNEVDPWVHGFAIRESRSGKWVGSCGFKGPPGSEGMVEIAYGVDAECQGQGYATEAAQALLDYAWAFGGVRMVRAHTLPEANASTRVLSKCGFRRIGEVLDPEDGLVWRWERRREES